MLRKAFLSSFFLIFSLSLSGQDTTDTSPGVIRVARKPITPYYKVEYKMFRMQDPSKGTDRKNPADSSAIAAGKGWKNDDEERDSLSLEPGSKLVFPGQGIHLSQFYNSQVTYYYHFTDTPRVDTMHVGFWIGTQGKVRQVYIREKERPGMPPALFDQVVAASMKVKKWDSPGGYLTPKRFLRKRRFVRDNYYCDMRLIMASYPMTLEQKKSGVHYSNKDVCLNPPAELPSKKKKRKTPEAEKPRS